MPRDKDFKKLVRRRMAETGERYTDARAAIDPDHDGAARRPSGSPTTDGLQWELTGWTFRDRLNPNPPPGPILRAINRFIPDAPFREPGSVGFPLPKHWNLLVTSTELIFFARPSSGSARGPEVGRVQRDRVTHIAKLSSPARSTFRRRIVNVPYLELGVDGDEPVTLSLLGSGRTAAEIEANVDRLIQELSVR